VKRGYHVTILFIIGTIVALIPMNFSLSNLVYAQSHDETNSYPESDTAVQQREVTQETKQQSMCISGDTTALSCNNLSSQDIGENSKATGPEGPPGAEGPQGETGATGPMGPEGPQGETGATGPMGPPGAEGPQGETGATGPMGPQSVVGKIYQITGPTDTTGPTFQSTASCNAGDNVLGGGFLANRDSNNFDNIISRPGSLSSWIAEGQLANLAATGLTIVAYANCFDNP
jgi:hypothetical protein